jgi:hypothetical protein
MVAALCFFYPKLAEGTHLILGTFHKVLKGLFIFVWVCLSLIFFAGKASMEKSSTLKTIAFLALDTSKIIAINSCVIYEGIGAVRSRTP